MRAEGAGYENFLCQGRKQLGLERPICAGRLDIDEGRKEPWSPKSPGRTP